MSKHSTPCDSGRNCWLKWRCGYWVHCVKHLFDSFINKSRRKTKAGSEEKRNVASNLGTDGPARQEKSPRASVIKLPVLVEEMGGRNVEEIGGKNVEPILKADRSCSARQEKSPRESPSTPQSRVEVMREKSVEDPGDGRVEDLEIRDEDGCGLTTMSVESVIRTPSPVSSISRPSVIVDNPNPRRRRGSRCEEGACCDLPGWWGGGRTAC